MTENLAGRGEGLKGLVAHWRKQIDGYTDDRAWVGAREVQAQCANELEDMLAALEAAAPAGTAPPTIVIDALRDHWPTWIDGEAPVEQLGVCSCGKAKANGVTPYKQLWSNHMGELVRAALATPSPQAPAPTGELSGLRELLAKATPQPWNKFIANWDDRLNGYTIPGAVVRGTELEDCPPDLQAAIFSTTGPRAHAAAELIVAAVRFVANLLAGALAATQEQPAGSGASEPYAYVCPANCGCMWRDNQDGTMSLFGPRSQSCKVCEPLPLEKLIPVHVGSPRKVGEDGAKVGDKVTWVGQEGKRFTESIRRITEPQPGNYVFWVGKDEFPVNHQEVKLVARSTESQTEMARHSGRQEVLIALTHALNRKDLSTQRRVSGFVGGKEALEKLLTELLHPSSAPVGKQKQEDGV